jgi:sporulation protein YlmC with PRC-barrel domain
MSKSITMAATCAAISFFLGTELPAQVDSAKPGTGMTPAAECNYLKASEIVGAKVHATPADDPKTGKAIGEVKDVIVDTNARAPHGAFAVLSDGELFTVGNDQIHGISCLRWNGASRKFAVDCSLPGTTPQGKKSAGMERGEAEASADRATANLRDAKAPSDTGVPSRMLMFSGIKGLKVYPQGSKDSVGKIDDLWIDTSHGCAGYMVVSSGGVLGVGDTTRLIPWAAASIERSLDLKDNQVNVRATKEVLEAAPKLEGKYEPNDPTIRAQACKAFGCEDPALAGKDTRSNKDKK